MSNADLCVKALELIRAGAGLRGAARQLEVATTTLHDWLTKPEFSEQYARAREDGCRMMAEEILEISDDGKNDWMAKNDPENPGYTFNGEHAQRSRLRVDTRKWLLSKMLPKEFGDKLELAGSKESPLTVNVVSYAPK